ncbi:DUF7504 family protein [Natronosalvus caseinilyticus]|uniref:DUF7504 family protein n=1 Tax=Natronosalvus caseinilyticus TaxID=2953747 RepID=UPI003CCCE8FE
MRWPFLTAGRSLPSQPFDPDVERAATVLVPPAAAAMGADPFTISTLNDRIDPDSVDRILANFPTDSQSGVRIAIEVSWDGASVLVRDDGHIEEYPTDQSSDHREAAVTLKHDWQGRSSLLWSVSQAIATKSAKSPAEISELLRKWLDPDALDRLLQPLFDETERHDSRLFLSVDGHEAVIGPDGKIVVEPSLAALKRAGATLLVVGTVPEQELDRAAATLLGDPDAARAPVFIHHGQDLETARRRLSMTGLAASNATALVDQSTARAGTAAASDGPNTDGGHGLTIVPVSGGIKAFPDIVHETISAINPSVPGELRVSVDSVRAMLGSSDLKQTSGVLKEISHMVHDHNGVGHFLLPIEADSDEVEALAPIFDAVVELRMGDVGIEQQWRLTATGYETPWFSLG